MVGVRTGDADRDDRLFRHELDRPRALKPAYLHRADDWYNYTYEHNGHQVKSYWQNPVGVDRGEPSLGLYAVNVLVGHHGVFSLTPIWLLSVAGVAGWMWRGQDPRLRGWRRAWPPSRWPASCFT